VSLPILGKLSAQDTNFDQLVDEVHFLAWFESDGFTRNDSNLGTRAWIAPDASLARPDIENAKAPQLNPVAGPKSILQAIENGIYGRLDLVSRQSGPLNDFLNDVLFNHLFTVVR
jgi:hypothetical protein